MSKFVNVKCSTGEFVRAVKTKDGYLTGRAVGRPEELIPFDQAILLSGDAKGEPLPRLTPTKAGGARALVIPKGDTFAAVADDLEADAGKSLDAVGRHDDVLRFYAARVKALVKAAPPVDDKADDEGEFRQLVKEAVKDAVSETLKDALRYGL